MSVKNSTNMSLRIWDEVKDLYDHEQLAGNWAKVDAHDHSPGHGVLIPTEGIREGAINQSLLAENSVGDLQIINGAVGPTALSTELLMAKSMIATSETRTNTAYGTLTTPDEVTVTLPENGLIVVAFQATWKESVAGAGRAAIFLGANQQTLATVASSESGPTKISAATTTNSAGVDVPLSSFTGGLCSIGTPTAAYAGDAVTGQAIGITGVDGISYDVNGTVHAMTPYAVGASDCKMFASAGTYKVTIQYKASSGSVTVKNRKLWAWVLH